MKNSFEIEITERGIGHVRVHDLIMISLGLMICMSLMMIYEFDDDF